jgi:hypothetical protein
MADEQRNPSTRDPAAATVDSPPAGPTHPAGEQRGLNELAIRRRDERREDPVTEARPAGRHCKHACIHVPKGDVTGPVIVASGFAYVNEVIGVLFRETDSGFHPFRGGETLLQPEQSAADGDEDPLWVVRFTDVPEGDYKMVLLGSPGEVLAHKNFHVKARKSAEAKEYYGKPVIDSPAPGDGVCPTFVASGTGDSGPATGTMTNNNPPHQVYHGLQLSGGPNWSLEFQNLAKNTTYTLSVTVAGTAADPQQNSCSDGGCTA